MSSKNTLDNDWYDWLANKLFVCTFDQPHLNNFVTSSNTVKNQVISCMPFNNCGFWYASGQKNLKDCCYYCSILDTNF